MLISRRISATYKDLPGGQVLGPTFDYTHRLLDMALAGATTPPQPATAPADPDAVTPRVTDIIGGEDLIERNPTPMTGSPSETSRATPSLSRRPRPAPAEPGARRRGFPSGARLLHAARLRRRNHPFVGEIRVGDVEVEVFVEELGFAVSIGDITVTECQMVNQFKGSATEPARFTRGTARLRP